MSGSNAYSPARDLTAKQAKTGGGMDMRLLWLCGCKSRLGTFRGRIPWKCAACVGKGGK